MIAGIGPVARLGEPGREGTARPGVPASTSRGARPRRPRTSTCGHRGADRRRGPRNSPATASAPGSAAGSSDDGSARRWAPRSGSPRRPLPRGEVRAAVEAVEGDGGERADGRRREQHEEDGGARAAVGGAARGEQRDEAAAAAPDRGRAPHHERIQPDRDDARRDPDERRDGGDQRVEPGRPARAVRGRRGDAALAEQPRGRDRRGRRSAPPARGAGCRSARRPRRPCAARGPWTARSGRPSPRAIATATATTAAAAVTAGSARPPARGSRRAPSRSRRPGPRSSRPSSTPATAPGGPRAPRLRASAIVARRRRAARIAISASVAIATSAGPRAVTARIDWRRRPRRLEPVEDRQHAGPQADVVGGR